MKKIALFWLLFVLPAPNSAIAVEIARPKACQRAMAGYALTDMDR